VARDYLQIVRAVEGLYPKSKGLGDQANFPNQDEQLRIQLAVFANEVFREVERMRRWRLGWKTAQITTGQGTALYDLPTDCQAVKRIWWKKASGGIQILRLADESEIRLVKGEGTVPPQGSPQLWAWAPANWITNSGQLLGTGARGRFQIWPAPDGQGPDSGQYTLQIDYYAELGPIVECVCSTTAGGSSLTLPSNVGNYLQSMGLSSPNPANAGSEVTVRGAGSPTGVTAIGNDDFTGAWGTISASSVTLPLALTPTLVTSAQTFFNSTSWLIRSFPKVVLFAMLREVASYLYADQKYQIWEQRYQKELELLQAWDDDAEHGVEVLAGAVGGQLQPQFRDIDLPMLYEIRGQ
jgi:hypothetical protein